MANEPSLPDMTDYFKVLGVSRDATDADVRRAFHKLSRELHPDVSTRTDAKARMQEVGEAFAVLKSEDKRLVHRANLRQWEERKAKIDKQKKAQEEQQRQERERQKREVERQEKEAQAKKTAETPEKGESKTDHQQQERSDKKQKVNETTTERDERTVSIVVSDPRPEYTEIPSGTQQTETSRNLPGSTIPALPSGSAAEGVAQSVAGQTVSNAVTSKVASSALGKAIGALAGSVLPIVGNIIMAVVGDFLSKSITKLGKEIGKNIGKAPVVIVSALSSLASTITSALASAVGTAFTFTASGLAILALLTAIILFIINSGAYIVAPGSTVTSVGTGGFGEAVECSTVKGPMPFTNSATDQTASRAWEIVADLYQGFWCYWNRSPVHIATDTVLYPPTYPQYFDYQFYLSNPSPNVTQGPAEWLFWCTWLVVTSYQETRGINLPLSTLGANTMRIYFTENGTFVPAGNVTPTNISPGDAIFFRRPSGSNTTHVAIVYEVQQDYIIAVQSNGPTKTVTITFNESGTGLQNLSANGDSSSIIVGVGSL